MTDILQSLLDERSTLQTKLAEVEAKIREAQQGQRKQAIDQIREIMSKYGISAADVSEQARAPKRQPAAEGEGRAKVAPKYRNAATGETWSGRGLQPKWLKAAIEGGSTIDDFKI